jgi:hypothetical protein
MKYYFLLIVLPLITAVSGIAQSTLQFSRVLIITAEETVPDNTVWKVVGMWGQPTEECFEMPCANCWGASTRTIASRRSFKINGDIAYQEISRKVGYSNGGCTSTNTSCGDPCLGPVPYKDNAIFPLWVPAGSTVSGVYDTKVSVIEFAIVP